MTELDQLYQVDCAVVIVTYNSARDITNLLDCLPAAAGELTLRIIVVDNGSTDATVALVRAYPEVICVEADDNLGYSGGINIGRQHAGLFRALAVLNPDLTLEADALHEMFTALDDDSSVGIAVPMILDFRGHLDYSIRREPTLTGAAGDALLGRFLKHRPAMLSEIVRDKREYGYRHPVEWATGAAMLISATCDRLIGAWDERFFLYSEEVDYATRTRAAGLRLEYVPQARARHRQGGSGRSDTLLALKAVNRVRYFEKHRRSAVLMRAIVALHSLLRSFTPGHRTALRIIVRRSSWGPLIAGLRTRSANATVGPLMKSYR